MTKHFVEVELTVRREREPASVATLPTDANFVGVNRIGVGNVVRELVEVLTAEVASERAPVRHADGGGGAAQVVDRIVHVQDVSVQGDLVREELAALRTGQLFV